MYVLIILVSFIAFPQQNEDDTTKSPYQIGINLSKESKENALEFWLDHKSQTKKSCEIDPRIGFTFIEMATSDKLRSYYKDASTMYNWALSSCSKAYKDVLKTELKRLRPIFENNRYNELKKLAKENISAVADSIKKIWYLKDPTPESKYNERLIEHWERIAYAKNNFTENSLTVYGTDERANIYIKYGKPELVESGVFTINTSKVMGWLSELDTYQIAMSRNHTRLSAAGRGGQSSSEIRQSNSGTQRMRGINLFARNIASKFPNPEYDIWFYDERQLTQDYPSDDQWMFIFGTEGDTRQYGRRKSIDEFIPKTAYRFTSRDRKNLVPPSIMLQMLMYDELSGLDHYFSESYNELQSQLFNNNALRSIRTHTSRILKKQNESKLLVRNNSTNSLLETSTYEQNLDYVNSRVTQFLFYDPQLEVPYYKTVCSFDIEKTLKLNYLKSNSSEYKFYLNISLQNQNQRKNIYETALNFNFTKDILNQELRYTNIFRVPAMPLYSQQLYHLTIQNKSVGNDISSDSPFEKNIIALHNNTIKNPKTPETNRFESFSVSDVILGYKDEQSQKKELGNLGFNFSHDYTFNKTSNLFLIFEVYNIPKQEVFHKFNLDYEIRKKEGGILNLSDNKDGSINRSISFTSNSSHFEEMLQIKTEYLQIGKYEIELKFSTSSNDIVSQTIAFNIK